MDLGAEDLETATGNNVISFLLDCNVTLNEKLATVLWKRNCIYIRSRVELSQFMTTVRPGKGFPFHI